MNYGVEDQRHSDEDSLAGHCKRFAGIFCIRFLVPMALLLVLAIGLGYFRLLQGPASMKFLVGPVERGIKAELEGLDPSVDDVVVTLTKAGGLEFQLKNLRLTETDGGVVASAPFAAMQLSPSALWALKIVPSKVVFIEPRVFLAYSKRGGLTLRFSQEETDQEFPRGLKAAPVRAINPNPVPGGSVDSDDGWRASVGGSDNTETSNADAALRGKKVGTTPIAATQSIDVLRMLKDATQRARAGSAASAYLREIGFRDATVAVDHEGHLSAWQVPRLSVDLDHRQSGSIVSGYATVSSGRGPWNFSFRLEDEVDTQSFNLTTTVRSLVPRTLGEVLPGLRMLAPFDMPMDGDAKLAFSRDGSLSTARLDLEIGAGRINLYSLSDAPLRVDAGLMRMNFDARTQELVIEPSTLRWGESSLTLVGKVAADSDARQEASTSNKPSSARWRFDINSRQGTVGASEFGVSPMSIDTWKATGHIWPQQSVVEIQEFKIGAGDAQVSISGTIDSSATRSGTQLEGRLSAMSAATVKALWPRGIAEPARMWIGQRLTAGHIQSGTIKFIAGRHMRQLQPGTERDHRLAMAFELADLKANPIPNAPALNAPRGLVRIENNALEVVIPNASADVGDGEVVSLSSGRFTVVNLDETRPAGEIAFKVQSEVAPVLTLLSDPNINVMQGIAIPFNGIAGKLAGDMRLRFPLAKGIGASDIKFGGKLRLSDGQANDVFGSYNVQGATLDFDITEGAMDARGEILLAGVLAKLNWQRIFAANEDQQPPIRLTATLDNSDRRQLGLDLDETVNGEVPVVVTITPRPDSASAVHLRADLTNADLLLENISWRKRLGRSAFLDCDVVAGERYPTLLQNLKIAGEDIGIEGWAGIDDKHQLVAFEFPKFSLDLITRLKMSGQLKPGPVWNIVAKGSTYDGRALFRSLFTVGQTPGRTKTHKAGEGIDLSATIDTVLGFEDAALKSVTFKMSKRGGALTNLEAQGTLNSGKLLNANFRSKTGGSRHLIASSPDAGEVFRVVGFYPNLRGGQMRLEVQLDGRGPATKTGTLWVEDFKILGDPIVSEVFSSAQDGRPSIAGGQGRKQNVVHEVFPFEQMRAPFSVGHGQFVLNDAYVRGPLLGATLRGKVDYTRRSLNIGGTYIPLQGINNIFRDIPLFGELLSGPRGEGIFGMTFAIQGAMDNPQVIVNPFSFVAPGILREIFQLTPYDPQVKPRARPQGTSPGDWGVRSSSGQVYGKGVNAGEPGRGQTQNRDRAVDGWSARTQGR